MHENKDQTALRMGALTKIAGVSDQTVRHYERMGLIHSLGRTQGGFRLFHPNAIERIQFIRAAQNLGFSLESIKLLLKDKRQDEQACKVARELMEDHLQELDQQIQDLLSRRAILKELAESCLRCLGPCHLEPELNTLSEQASLLLRQVDPS